MTASGDPEFGLRLFEEAAMGKTDLEGNTALLYAYGNYLAHGGTPSDFMNMTIDDIQIMLVAYKGAQKRAAKSVINEYLHALSKNGE